MTLMSLHRAVFSHNVAYKISKNKVLVKILNKQFVTISACESEKERVCVCACVCMCACMCVYVWVHVSVCMCVCACMCVCMHVIIYVCH